MKKKLPFFLLLILLLEITISVESQSPALLKYVLQWPPTFCIHLNSTEEGKCKEPVPEHEFTLHGLMQADEEGFSIVCDPGEDPNWDELFEPIKDELVTFWPSLREDFNETELWKHEWRAHGACGEGTPAEYFDTAIEINNKPEQGNLFNYLEANEIVPSDSSGYPKEDIVEAIQNVFDESLSLIHSPLLRRRSPPPRRRSPPPPRRRSPPPPRRSPPPPRRSPPPPRRSPPPPRRSPPPPRRSPPPPPRRSPPPPPPRRSPPPPPRRSPPPPPPRRSPPPPPRRSPPPPPPRSPPPPPPSPPPPSPPPPPPPPHNIYLSCIPINPENTTHVYLSEVTLCTNLYGSEFISCPLEADPASCPDEALIMLPLPQPQEAPDLPLDIWKAPMGNILRYSTAEIDSLL